MPRVLHMAHCDEREEMPHVQAVRRRVEPDIKGNGFASELFVQLVFVHRLFDKSPRAQGVHYVLHINLLFSALFLYKKTAYAARKPYYSSA